jgi:hypothetical protein
MSEDEFLSVDRKTVRRDYFKDVVLPAEHERLVGAAKTRHGVHQRIEHRLEVDGGTADYLEHVAGRGLLLKGFS